MLGQRRNDPLYFWHPYITACMLSKIEGKWVHIRMLQTAASNSIHISNVITILLLLQMLWSKEFAEAVFSDRNLEDKTPLQLAVENGHIK